jgi:nucleoid-associated protein EbfC
MGSGFSKMKKQARQMEQQMEAMKEELKSKSFIGTSGNGLVTVTVNGEKALTALKIKPECVDPSDVEGLEDLITAAFSEAFTKAEKEGSSEGLSLPF